LVCWSPSAFFSLQRTKLKPQKGQDERMARMPRNLLLDALFALFREHAVADQSVAGEDAAAGGVPEGGAVRNCESTSQWRVQRYLGAHAELQGRWGTLIDIRHDRLQGLTLFLLEQIKPEGMLQLYASQPSNPDVSMDDYDEEEDEDDMEEVME
jgi:transcription initiation factor TFIIF subunit beta